MSSCAVVRADTEGGEEFDDPTLRRDSGSISEIFDEKFLYAVAACAATAAAACLAGALVNTLLLLTSVVLTLIGCKIVFKRFESNVARIYCKVVPDDTDGVEEFDDHIASADSSSISRILYAAFALSQYAANTAVCSGGLAVTLLNTFFSITRLVFKRFEKNVALQYHEVIGKQQKKENEERHKQEKNKTEDLQRTQSQHARSAHTETMSAMDFFRYSFDAEMIRFNKSVELSSYCLCTNNDLVVHPMKPGDASTVERLLRELLERYDVFTRVKVLVRPDPVVATSCVQISNGVLKQNIGLYIGEEGSVYWLSVAHGVVQSDLSKEWHTPDATFSMHSGDVPSISIKLPYLSTKGSMLVNLPTPYVCFSMSERGFKMSEGKSLYHGVDIMVGPTTAFSDDSLSTWFPMRNTPSEGSSPSSVNSLKWIRVDVAYLPEEDREGGMSFSANELVGISLESYSWDDHKTLRGCVQHGNYNVKFVFNEQDEVRKDLKNAILIRCQGPNKPERGHSGSVWILRKATRAANITNARDRESEISRQREPVGQLAIASATCDCNDFEDAAGTTAATSRNEVQETVAVASTDAEHTVLREDTPVKNASYVDSTEFEAVAVTVATLHDRTDSYWVAAPLCSSLYALRKVYPKKFPEQNIFKGIGLYAS